MTLSNYPQAFDSDANLYLVHDGLRIRLAEDYNPGDTKITVDSDSILSKFPPTGIITLTEQCSEISVRASSFEYTEVDTTNNLFTGLTLLDGFEDVAKPKRLTNVTLNVVDRHHNSLKDALIAVEEFAGKRGEVSTVPLEGTLEQRINYLRKSVLKPKAWIVPSATVGIVPFEVTFADFSLRAPTDYEYNFGDGHTASRTFPYVPGQAEGTADSFPDGTVTHTYTTPGLYNVTLTVTNPFGTDTIEFQDFIFARTSAPDAATIAFNPGPTQLLVGDVIRSRTNIPIEVRVTASGEQASDPITNYTWSLSDDFTHANLDSTDAQYSIGGLYDVKLRTDTTLGAYRISVFPQVIDVVESQNLWMSIFDPLESLSATTKNAYTYEFGLISEVFKIKSYNPLSVTRNADFLTGLPSEAQQKREFRRNNGFTPRTLTDSGDQGTSLFYWSEGASTFGASQAIRMAEFNGFTDTYSTPSTSQINRDWNWTSFNSPDTIYFLFGQNDTPIDLVNPVVQDVDLATLTVGGTLLRSDNNFENGAEELLTNVGDGTDGEFSVYRSCWKDSVGYILRNEATGSFFRLKSFYRTEGVLDEPVKSFLKLPDILGDVKLEGQLVALVDGIYFFNNTGEIAIYDPNGNVWATGGPGVGSPAFSTLQDNTVSDFNNPANTLVAASDGDRLAFLSFDYSASTFIKFNQVDRTFNKLPNRPLGEQFAMTVY
jgi:PKD repeat protein